MSTPIRQLLAYLLVIALSVGASLMASNKALDDTKELEARVEKRVATALVKVDRQRIEALRIVCVRDAATSDSSIEVRKNQAKNDKKVAESNSTSPGLKRAKRDQVKAEKKSAAALERLKCVPEPTK